MNNTKRELSHKVIITGLAVIFSLIMALSMISAPTVQISSTASPQVATSTGSYIPNPTMNANITWSTFYNGWNPLEYSNGTANLTLNAQESTFYQNPISVNPADIQTNALQGKIGNIAWNQSSSWGIMGGSATTVQQAGSHAYIIVSSSDTGATWARNYINISEAYLPSTHPAYDYISALVNVQETGQVTGDGFWLSAQNNSQSNPSATGAAITNGTTTAVYQPAHTGAWFVSTPLSAFMSNDKSGYVLIDFQAETPETTTNGSNVQNLSILGMALTTSPMTLGSFINATGTHTVSAMTQSFTLNQFNPNFAWSKVSNNGYSVAVSQTLQDTTESQSAISSINYIEQATYQGMFSLPTAPDLSYVAPNITMPITLSGNQFEVANLNGVSFLSTLQTKDNGTFSFGTVNPNNQNTLILEVEYTASQWNASTSAPSFFSIQGIEYYWWVGVIGLLSLIGLGSVASAHWGGTEENLKIPKGKFGR